MLQKLQCHPLTSLIPPSQSPRPAEKWTGTWNATYPRSSCVQLDLATRQFSGSEDCLYLNVYRPVASQKLLPVMVFIHGGSFKGGSAHPSVYGADFLMDTKEVILVTLQYRLGVFGFLAADHPSCKGNFGLKDQNLALHWVYENIDAFGGDPQAVTLVGQSAGAASVQLQMVSHRSNGLFHRAVMLSGSALAFWAVERQPEVFFRRYAALAGVPDAQTKSARDIVRELRGRTAQELLRYELQIPILHPILFTFRPVVEGPWGGAFLIGDPHCLWASGRYEQRPFLTGLTGYEEGAWADLFYNQTMRRFLQQNWEESMSSALDLPQAALVPLRDFYFDGRVTQENMIQVLRVSRHRLLDFPLYQTVELYSRYGDLKTRPMHLYLFNFTSQISTAPFTNPFPIEGRGASHADDLLYLFRNRLFDAAFEGVTPESGMRDLFVSLLVDYVTKGGSSLHVAGPCRREDLQRGFCRYLDIQRVFRASPSRVQLSSSSSFDLRMVPIHRLVEQQTRRQC